MAVITPTTDELRKVHKLTTKLKLSPALAELFITGKAEMNGFTSNECLAFCSDEGRERYGFRREE